MSDYNNLYKTEFEKVLSVGKIKKSNSSYGNYYFLIGITEKGLNGFYNTEKFIYASNLKEIKILREKYFIQMKGGLKEK